MNIHGLVVKWTIGGSFIYVGLIFVVKVVNLFKEYTILKLNGIKKFFTDGTWVWDLLKGLM